MKFDLPDASKQMAHHFGSLHHEVRVSMKMGNYQVTLAVYDGIWYNSTFTIGEANLRFDQTEVAYAKFKESIKEIERLRRNENPKSITHVHRGR